MSDTLRFESVTGLCDHVAGDRYFATVFVDNSALKVAFKCRAVFELYLLARHSHGWFLPPSFCFIANINTTILQINVMVASLSLAIIALKFDAGNYL
ncbi:MAG TPA: hypothetical protein DIW43_00360 [Spongiibacteraceae bacterium]|nr:hypothetical protein [Spongiibacteraceae bacterium]HCS25871.1 hypothetical protein [Spongiibacteraceae bacterium]